MISVLVVDENSSIRDLCTSHLEQGGDFSVDTCKSTDEAVERLKSAPYDLVLSGHRVPEIDGIALLKEVRSLFSDLPFILFTGNGSEDVAIEALNGGADFYIRTGGDPKALFSDLTGKMKTAVERHRARTTAYETGRKYRSVLDNVENAIFLADRDARIVDVNEAACRQLGYSRGELLGMDLLQITDVKLPGIKERMRTVRENRIAVSRTTHRHKDGHIIPVDLEVTRLEYDSQVFFLGSSCEVEENITDDGLRSAYLLLKRREEDRARNFDSLSRNKDDWESTFNAISDWIALISPEGEILRTNKASESVAGVPYEQVLGRMCFQVLHGAECPGGSCPRRRMLETGKREVTEVQTRDGTGWVQVTVDPVLDSEGAVVSAVHIVKDITGAMRSQKALEQAKKKLNLLNYVTFNDIQNLIFSLSAYQQLVKDSVTDPGTITIIENEEELLQKIAHSLKSAQSYQDLGLKSPRWQEASHVFLMAISHLNFLGIERTVELDGLEIFADPLLEQVFQILADNTLTHGETATRVKFSYAPGPDSVTLVYEDNGVGIPDHIKERIFSQDFQNKKGLGLFLAREILEITGIAIRETGAPGRGARFELIVPRGAWQLTAPSKTEKGDPVKTRDPGTV